MKGVVRTSHEKKSVCLKEVDQPQCGPTEVLLRIKAAGICGSDVSAYLGKPEYDYMSIPTTLGHECAGIVEEIGSQIQEFSLGERVVLKPGDPCGTCFHCSTGKPNNCPNREPAVAEGGFAPYLATTPEKLIRIPEGVSMEHAAITEPLAVTHRAVVTNGEVSPGDSVLVQGPGPMGAFSALIAEAAGADVVVTGLSKDSTRLNLLSDVGVETTINPFANKQKTQELLNRHAERDGFDVTIDATGAATAIKGSIRATRNGGNLVVLGIASNAVDLDLAELVRAEIDLRTSHGSVTEDFIRALTLLKEADTLPIEQLIDSYYTPAEPVEAFEAFIAADTIKQVFDLDILFD